MDKYFEELMKREDVNFIKEKTGLYGIRVLGPGKNLFFRENDRGLVCDIDAVHGVIYKKTINTWDTEQEKMSKPEKERVTELILKYYKKVYNPDAVIK